ncbi:MAG: hypothetical protein HC899_37745 [Leptolyngbyaceae cyanobacterium SM1_4_3]|nr:hypothetical protein [Leptolyngbyaceae cyanobacterium SM1_4_3]
MLSLANSLYLLLEQTQIPEFDSFDKFNLWLKRQSFPVLGKGSARIVYDLKDGTVLKALLNDYYVEHNTDEIEIIQCMNGEFCPELIDWDKKNFWWLRLEKLYRITREELYEYWVIEKKLPDISVLRPGTHKESSFSVLFPDLLYMLAANKPFPSSWNKEFMRREEILKIPEIAKLVELFRKCKFDPTDLGFSNWSKTKDGRIVISDLGGFRLR